VVAGKSTLNNYIYFTYPDDKKLRLGHTYYAKEFQCVLKDGNDREVAYDHAKNMVRHGDCLWYHTDEESIDICNALRTKILNTRERSMAYITYSDNLDGKTILLTPLKELKSICSFDADDTGDEP